MLKRLFQRRRDNTGDSGEQLAAEHLRRAGYRILGRNLRTRLGEIDILAEDPDGRTVVFVEVKSSDNTALELRPEVHVNPAKRRKLTLLAAQLARKHKLTDRALRFDIIGIDAARSDKPLIRHHKNAFEAVV